MRLYVGDACPSCSWILTLVDFSFGRCGHCLYAQVPLDLGAARELEDLKVAAHEQAGT